MLIAMICFVPILAVSLGIKIGEQIVRSIKEVFVMWILLVLRL